MSAEVTRIRTDSPAAKPLTAKQLRAVEALLSSPSIVAAAKVAGSNEATIRRWLRTEPAFRAAVENGARELRRSALASVTAGMQAAADTLRTIVTDPKASEQGRLRAADLLLSYGVGEMTLDVEARLAALESHRWDDARPAG